MLEVIHSYRINDFHRSGIQIKEEDNKIYITLISSNNLGNKLQEVICTAPELNEIIHAVRKMQKALDITGETGNIEG